MGEYTEEFYRLWAQNNLKESNNQLIAQLNSIWPLSQAIHFTFKAEHLLEKAMRGGIHKIFNPTQTPEDGKLTTNNNKFILNNINVNTVNQPASCWDSYS